VDDMITTFLFVHVCHSSIEIVRNIFKHTGSYKDKIFEVIIARNVDGVNLPGQGPLLQGWN